MDPNHSISPLQVRILVGLSHQEVKTVTELAECVKAPGPSTSRALTKLKYEGFVFKEKTLGLLTKSGKELPQECEEIFLAEVKKMSKAATRTFEKYQKTLHLLA